MQTALFLIDWQEKLFSAMPQGIRDRNLKQACTLHWYARETEMPILVSEQYPKGLGKTLPEIDVKNAIPKTHFSALREDRFLELFLEQAPDRVILTGMETHICVLQTARDLIRRDVAVVVPVDAVLSRRRLDWQFGLKQLENAGVILATTESVLFEQLGKAGGAIFKELSRRIR